MAVTATATKKVQLDIINVLSLKNALLIKTTFDRPNLYVQVDPKANNPLDNLLPLLSDHQPTIIYCQTRKMTEKLS